MRLMRFVLALLLALTVVSSAAIALQIDWYSINCGGGQSSSASYTLNATIGQPAAGFVSSASILHWVGFWAGEVPTPIPVSNIAAAKQLADGIYVSIAGRIATTAVSDFTDFFYIQERDRFSGIRVAAPPVAGLARGSVVNVIGTMGTTASGERQLVGPMVILSITDTPPAPLGMINRSLGGTGLDNVGLLVTTWGRVDAIEGTDMLITDGSGDCVRVNVAGLSSLPTSGQYISVVGISSLMTSGSDTKPYILPRTRSDIH